MGLTKLTLGGRIHTRSGLDGDEVELVPTTTAWSDMVGLRSTAAPFNSVWVVDFAMGNAGKGLARGTDQADLGGGRIHTRSGLDGDEVELVPTTTAWSDMVGLRSTAAPFNSVWVVDFAMGNA